MAASSQSMEQQILQSAKEQLTSYLSRWKKHYSNEVQQIMTDLYAGQSTPAPLAFARLLNALFAISITNPGSALQEIRRSISQSLLEIDGEGNNSLMLAARDCHEAFTPLLQAVNNPLFLDKERLLLQQNTHRQTALDLALEYYTNHPSTQVQIEMACLSEAGRIAVVRQIGAQLLSGNYQSDDVFISLCQANPEVMRVALAELVTQCDSEPQQAPSNAMILRAYMHEHGLGGPVNYPEAIGLYEQTILLDNARAMTKRASMHRLGEGGPANYPEAITLYERAIALNEPLAMSCRAYMHEHGLGGPVNDPEAITLYERAIALGEPRAMINQAYRHAVGQGGPVNYTEAARLYEQAIALGKPCAMNDRAYMHQVGQGGPVNYTEAARLCDQAIALGEPGAMNRRAYMHHNGQGGPVNYTEATRLYERGIALGNATSMYNRADMHLRGQGGPVNYPEAIRLFRLAAERGIQEAVHALTLNTIQRYINEHPDLQEGPAIASSSSAEASAPELGKGDIAFVEYVIFDLIKISCDTITGTRKSISIQLTIGIDLIKAVTSFASSNPERSMAFVSTDGVNFQVTINNMSYEDIKALIKQDKPELEVVPELKTTSESLGEDAASNPYNRARFWKQSDSDEEAPPKQPGLENINTP